MESSLGNGCPRRDSASPAVALESIFLTTIFDVKEGRDIMTADVPKGFIQTNFPTTKEGKECVIMKITGVLVNLLVQLAPEVYGPCIVYENGKKVLHVQVLKALYGMLLASLLCYKKFRSDLENKGFKFNIFDPCVADKNVKGKQQTIRFHVDDLMSSHVDSRGNNKFEMWLNQMYGEHGKVKSTYGDIHDYLGMTFDFSQQGKVIIDVINFIEAMVDDCSQPFGPRDVAKNAAPSNLFEEGTSSKLSKKMAQELH